MGYTREDGCRAWLTYGMINPDILAAILEECGSAEAVYDEFQRSGGRFLKQWRVNDASIAALQEHAPRQQMHEMMVTMRKLDVGVIALGDNAYPDALRNIQNPPAILFYRGNPDCLVGKCIAVVGSRTPTPRSEMATHDICRELSDRGVTIISGFAMGVDTAAHRGCLAGASPTAAVLACGIDVIYPQENEDLREEIVAKGGVLLSEYPLGMRSGKHVFQMRNRIISGLAKAVLMMEARIQSGSMITVQHALDQGRDVFAYPGVPDSEASEGAHQLLREGAIYFTSAQDVLEDLSWAEDGPAITQQQKKALPEMNDEQRRIYALLGQGEMSFDELSARSGIPTPQLSVSLTLMQMSGVIRALPGKTYCRI
ncbi:MAG: DNA-processing protein DprA [Clostridia bacterium]|nr:DNA-processing protein DprA [Clostridia bacterium]